VFDGDSLLRELLRTSHHFRTALPNGKNLEIKTHSFQNGSIQLESKNDILGHGDLALAHNINSRPDANADCALGRSNVSELRAAQIGRGHEVNLDLR